MKHHHTTNKERIEEESDLENSAIEAALAPHLLQAEDGNKVHPGSCPSSFSPTSMTARLVS